jgi:hypothetical protein
MVALNVGHRAIFLYGFAKNDSPNVTVAALEAFRINAADLLRASEAAFAALVATNVLREIKEI